MKQRALVRSRSSLSVFFGVVVLLIYLMLTRADGVVGGGSMLHAIFAYTFDAGVAVSYALRSALVFLLSVSAMWLLLSLMASEEAL